jgi:hypothetical protein
MGTTTAEGPDVELDDTTFRLRATDPAWIAGLDAFLTDAVAEGRCSVFVQVDADADLTGEALGVLEQCAVACAFHDIELWVLAAHASPAHRALRITRLSTHTLAWA